MAKSYFGRLRNKAKKVVKKRYLTKRNLPKVGRIIKDVSKLKRMINVEKKYVEETDAATTPIQVGQFFCPNVNTISYGYKMKDITPNIAVGNLATQRNGQSVKLTGLSLKFQLFQMSGTICKTRIAFDLFMVDTPMTINDTTALQIYDLNVFNGLIDYNSERNVNYLGVYKKICSRKLILDTDNEGIQSVKDYTIHLKLNKHLRFLTNDTPLQTQYIAVFRADCGNSSGVAPTTLPANLPFSNINSGVNICNIAKWWFVDN